MNRSIHDHDVLGYSVVVESRTIVLHTGFRGSGVPFARTDVRFDGVLGYWFRDNLGGILRDIVKVDIARVAQDYADLFRAGAPHGWPFGACDNDPVAFVASAGATVFRIDSSIGFDGFVVCEAMTIEAAREPGRGELRATHGRESSALTNELGADLEPVEAFARPLRVERDVVCFLHRQAAYSSVVDDIDWTLFDEDYAQVLVENREMPADIQRGVLALLYAMGMCEAGNVGVALGDRLPGAVQQLELLTSDVVEVQQLRNAAIRALQFASAPQASRDWGAIREHLDLANWVHRVAVRPFFRSIASSFEPGS